MIKTDSCRKTTGGGNGTNDGGETVSDTGGVWIVSGVSPSEPHSLPLHLFFVLP